MKRTALIAVAFLAACSGRAHERPVLEPGIGFLSVVNAVIEELASVESREAVQVDPRPIRSGATSVLQTGFVDDPEVIRRRREALAEANLSVGDMAVAEECNHVGGMGGLLIEPLTDAQRELIQRCGTAFSGYTVAASLPEPSRGGVALLYRVLVFGDDSEYGWEVVVSEGGELLSIDLFMKMISE